MAGAGISGTASLSLESLKRLLRRRWGADASLDLGGRLCDAGGMVQNGQQGPRRRRMFWGLLLAALGAGAPAAAQNTALPVCFGGEEEVSRGLTLAAPLRLDAGCEYALSPAGPFGRVSERRDIMSLLDALGWQEGQPSTVYGRQLPVAAVEEGEQAPAPLRGSVFVDHCTDYMLRPGGGFRVAPGSTAERLRVVRSGDRCGANSVALTFQCAGQEPRELNVGADSLELPPCARGWAVQAQRRGGAAYPLRQSLSVGSVTPLQAAVASGEALLRPRLSEGVSFEVTGSEAAFRELRAAFAAGSARLVRAPGSGSETACEGTAPEVPVVFHDNGLSLPDAVIAGELSARYGAHRGMGLGVGELQEVVSELHLCLAPTYGARQEALRNAQGTAVPIGASFAQVADAAQLGERWAAARVCVEERRTVLTPDGPELDEASAPRCMAAREGAVMASVVGSIVEVPEGSVLCQGRDEVAAIDGEARRYVLPRGFVDVRVAGTHGCRSLQALSLGRIGSIDPASDWHPVGVQRSSRGIEVDAMPAWAGVRAHDPRTFARERRGDELRFRLTTPEGFAEAWNADHREGERRSIVGNTTPRIGNEGDDFGHGASSAFSTVISDDEACPAADDELRGNAVNMDERVFVHLLLGHGEQRRCVAVAAFRTWEPRVVFHTAGSERRQFHIGLLGDLRFGMFFSKFDNPALGIALPLIYGHLHLKKGFLFEVSVPFTAAMTWTSRESASRVGPALMTAISWGWPDTAPRLLTAAFLVHAPWPHSQDQAWSFFVGVNLSSLWDLAGGR